MKVFLSTLIVFMMLISSCKNENDIEPKNLIGKWRPTYEFFNDSTQKWEVIKTYMLLPDIEFTLDSKFLINNHPGAEYDCCGYIGNQFEIVENRVVFSGFGAPCPNASCFSTNCKGWHINKLTEEVLEIEQCPNATYRYTKMK